MVYAAFHYVAQGVAQFFLVYIVLVLAYADGFRFDFNQFGQRVLDAAGNGYGAPQGHVQVRQFFFSQRGGGVYGGACLADNQIRQIQFMLFDHFGRELFRFERSCPVADGHEGNTELLNQFHKTRFCVILLPLAADDVQGIGGQDLALGIDDCGLAAGTVTGIQSDDRVPRDGLLQQQLPQIDREYIDSLLFRFLCQFIANFPFNGRENQPLVSIGAGFGIHFGKPVPAFDFQEAMQLRQHVFFRVI